LPPKPPATSCARRNRMPPSNCMKHMSGRDTRTRGHQRSCSWLHTARLADADSASKRALDCTAKSALDWLWPHTSAAAIQHMPRVCRLPAHATAVYGMALAPGGAWAHLHSPATRQEHLLAESHCSIVAECSTIVYC
jgi:hypothetical protein